MASRRIVPYWLDNIAPQLLHGKNQLIVAHGSTLRALIKYIEGISDEEIDGVEVANAVPIIYELDHKLRIVTKKTL
ncbi:phosphoglycerate mutase [Liquorilactobacillus sucicola DSM 21376 = JCM 15457]|nr:phosphoglycerate mutase [Liquorilactobacillus sucicola DSM 21376 = JCM 15457]